MGVCSSRCLFSLSSSSSSSSSSLLLVFGVVRAQPCEHARYPRTPLCSLVVFSCCLLSAPRLSSCPVFFLRVGMAVGVTMCRCVVLA